MWRLRNQPSIRWRSAQFQVLERRIALAAQPIITEFMASNDRVLVDDNGNSSDWIEIYNAGDEPVNLAGYSLSDDPDDSRKWTFPTDGVNQERFDLDPGDYLVVFANDDAAPNTGTDLYTGFGLKASGEFIGLFDPADNLLSAFGNAETNYPAQASDVSYGYSFRTSDAGSDTFIEFGSDARVHIPTSSAADSVWRSPTFNDDSWTLAPTPVGYEDSGDDYGSLFSSAGTDGFDGTDLRTEIADSPNLISSVYLRYEFEVNDTSAIDLLSLDLQFEDGFIAYLNDQEVASVNGVSNPRFSSSTNGVTRSDRLALTVESFPLSVTDLVEGKNVLAVHLLNSSGASSDLLFHARLSSSGAIESEITMPFEARFFATPTPGAANEVGTLGFVSVPTFSAGRGFYTESFDVVIATDTAAATIRYTLDGTAPTEANGFTYARPIEVSQTTTLRAAAFRAGYTPSEIDTQTYLFADDVVNQSEIDDRVGSPEQISASLLALPSISLVTAETNLFGRRGIHTNPQQRGADWERPVSIEYFSPSGELEFQEDAGIRIHGADTRSHDKKIFRLHLRSEYGAANLDQPVLPHSGLEKFDQLLLRTGGHDAWTSPHGNQSDGATYIRDEFLRRTQQDAGHVAPAGEWVHLYLNGTYWGLYNLTERINDDFSADHFGGEEEDYDVISGNDSSGAEVNDGEINSWNTMIRGVLRNRSMTDDERFLEIQQHIDIENFVDMMAIRIWDGDTDWLRSSNESQTGNRSKNWFATKSRNDPQGRWRFPIWDSEFGTGHDHRANRVLGINLTDVDHSNSIGEIYRRLKPSAEFRQYFGDRIQKLMFNHGPLSPAKTQARWQDLEAEVGSAILAESARWGDTKNSRDPFTPEDWVAESAWVRDIFLPRRNSTVLRQFSNIELFPNVDAPRIVSVGGVVSAGSEVRFEDTSGVTYYTLDGTDPRAPGGEVSPTAIDYSGTPVTITETSIIRARTLESNEWSAVVDLDDFIVETQARVGDANGDGDVGFADFLILSTNFGKVDAVFEQGDFDLDGVVGFADFLLLSQNFGSNS